MRRTKIICTIGPATSSYEMIVKLAENGMNVARLNFSHGTHQEHKETIDKIKRAREHLDRPLGILLDTKGPEIRIGHMTPLPVHKGDLVYLVKEAKNPREVPIDPPFVVDEIERGAKILFDDGYIQGKIVQKEAGRCTVEIENQGTIKSRKGVNLPDQNISLPDLTPIDEQDIRFGLKEGVEMIAASFIRSAKQVLAIKDLLDKEGKSHVLVIAKIENRQGVDNFHEIIDVADGIMVARGDLGVELFVAHVPPLQKMMIRECNKRGKPVIIATQMLESMIQNPMPTRAEASDVANAIYDSASCVMLSGETAIGSYPVNAVKMMHEIICEAEKDFDYASYFAKITQTHEQDVPSGVARAAVTTAYNVHARALIVCSNGGNTVKRICKFRPEMTIIAVTPSKNTYHQTSLFWGTEGFMEKNIEIDKGFYDISCTLLKKGLVKYGDSVVITSGKPYGVSFTTNSLMVETIGQVTLRGKRVDFLHSEEVTGEVVLLHPGSKNLPRNISGRIVVTTRIRESDLELLKGAKAIILQDHPLDRESETLLLHLSKLYNIPVIARADASFSLLNENAVVRVNPRLGLVFKGNSPTEKEMLLS